MLLQLVWGAETPPWQVRGTLKCGESPGSLGSSVGTGRQKAGSWSTPAASREPDRGRKEDPGGIAAAVMRKLEARVKRLNNADLKQLQTEKGEFEEKCQRTKRRGIWRRSNDIPACWNLACEWSLHFRRRTREKYNCREAVVGTHWKYESAKCLPSEAGRSTGQHGLWCCWWERGSPGIRHDQGFGDRSRKLLSAPTDSRHHSHGSREKCIAGPGSGAIKAEVRISGRLTVEQSIYILVNRRVFKSALRSWAKYQGLGFEAW